MDLPVSRRHDAIHDDSAREGVGVILALLALDRHGLHLGQGSWGGGIDKGMGSPLSFTAITVVIRQHNHLLARVP